jgi:hypothetical protein
MSDRPLVSIIVNNYNYGRFLPLAVDSALSQTYQRREVIVVDDGSTDDSRDRIAPYAGRIRPVFKENGGQASAFNAGFAASKGEIVIFLDADDVLLATAAERAVECFAADDMVKVHWPLWVIDERGTRTGAVEPAVPLPEGDLAARVLGAGPDEIVSSPTSGNAWSRRFLQRVLPMPETEYRVCADAYLFCLAPICGPIVAIHEPLALYRRHRENSYARLSPLAKLHKDQANYELQCAVLERFCRRWKIAVEPAAWKRNAWAHQLLAALEEIDALIPPGESFVLVDGAEWGQELVEGRRVIPFLERDGLYWGAPPDDATAIRELERLRAGGASHVVVGWPAFWWLEHYQGWHRHLRANFACVADHDRLVVFDIRARPVGIGDDRPILRD